MFRTRFAPSPTGYLHIGGVRTALFNWLLARQSGGQFVLRIDDTDAVRNVESALQPILDGFRWLGIDWDEGPEVGGPHAPYYQSQRGESHQAAVQQLLASGHAYRDYARPEELQELRAEAERRKDRFFYDRRWMAETDRQAAAFEAEGRPQTVRLKMPRAGQCVVDDLIRGQVCFDWDKEQDAVVQRPDGTCLYHLASAIDDHELQITHVVRAEEHLSNTPRQLFILDSLGYPRPRFAHLPYVAEPGGSAKLSKRKLAKYEQNKDFAELLGLGRAIAERCGIATDADTFNPVIVDFYRELGFAPAAILNYLLLLGWSLDGQTEKFTRQEMIEKFSLDRVNKAPASFDPKKLLAFQADAFAALPLETRIETARSFAERAGWCNRDQSDRVLPAVVQAAGDRMRIGGDILDFDYCFEDSIEYDEKAFVKRICKPADARPLLADLRDHLSRAASFDAESIERSIQDFCQTAGVELKQIIHALRIAVTGRPAGFGLFETLAILGQQTVIERISAALEKAATICAAT